MCEDGTGAYLALFNNYIKDYEVAQTYDEVYENYLAKAKAANIPVQPEASEIDPS